MLVIVLATIVILASIGIYYLLRDREPSAAERATRRKYSIRGNGGARKHSLSIGLPGSLSEKIGSMFKGRRSGAGWEPANDEADEWDSTDEPLPVYHHAELPYDAPHKQGYPRVGSAPPSQRTTLTEASETYKSRMASHVDDPSEEGFHTDRIPIPYVEAPEGPDEVWLNAPDGRDGLGSVGDIRHMGYHAPQPHRADSGPEIPLFAGSAPFRQDI